MTALELKMRRIQIVPAIAEEASGPSYSVVRLCESLIAAGQAVTLAAPGTPWARRWAYAIHPHWLKVVT